jgi:hypothetical protein
LQDASSNIFGLLAKRVDLILYLGQLSDDLGDLKLPGAQANLKQDIFFPLSLLRPFLEILVELSFAL